MALRIRHALWGALAVVSGTTPCAAQSTFQRDYGVDTVSDYGERAIELPTGGFLLAGGQVYQDSAGLEGESVLLRVTANGDTLWRRAYPIPGTESAFFYDVIRSDDRWILTGELDSGYAGGMWRRSVLLACVDTAGQMLWWRSIGGAHTQLGEQIEQAADGGFAVAGRNAVTGSAGDNAFYLVRTDSMGDTLWTRTYDHEYNSRCYGLAPTPTGGWVMAGAKQPWSEDRPHLKSVDANGDTLWTRTLDWAGQGQATDVQVLPNGTIVALGYNFPGGGCVKPLVVAFNPNGDTLWSRNYDHGGCEWAYSLCHTTTGFAFTGDDTDDRIWLTNIDFNGDTMWSKHYSIGVTSNSYSVVQTSDGGFLLCGEAIVDDIQMFMIKTDAFGNVVTSTHDLNMDPRVHLCLFPNPTNGPAMISFRLPAAGVCALALFDAAGRQVRSILEASRIPAGERQLPIDFGTLSPGAYTLVITIDGSTATARAIRL